MDSSTTRVVHTRKKKTIRKRLEDIRSGVYLSNLEEYSSDCRTCPIQKTPAIGNETERLIQEEIAAMEMENKKKNAQNCKDKAKKSEDKAKNCEDKAKIYEDKAKIYEDKAKNCEDKAKNCEDKAKNCEDKAKKCEDKAKNCEDRAKKCEEKAKKCEDKAKKCEDKAKKCEDKAKNCEDKGQSKTYAKPTTNQKVRTIFVKPVEPIIPILRAAEPVIPIQRAPVKPIPNPANSTMLAKPIEPVMNMQIQKTPAKPVSNPKVTTIFVKPVESVFPMQIQKPTKAPLDPHPAKNLARPASPVINTKPVQTSVVSDNMTITRRIIPPVQSLDYLVNSTSPVHPFGCGYYIDRPPLNLPRLGTPLPPPCAHIGPLTEKKQQFMTSIQAADAIPRPPSSPKSLGDSSSWTTISSVSDVSYIDLGVQRNERVDPSYLNRNIRNQYGGVARRPIVIAFLAPQKKPSVFNLIQKQAARVGRFFRRTLSCMSCKEMD